ncbi:hypothetical protein [Pontibacter ramchanderi]|uniref:DUF4251 domain-containing protein n=1 Tax=Pontibacter ramchanderi TaxID=1179743 RepID=A0A2N3U816_9BACT|nr:hypothetical protein [Pontibacter ramchanderi]PKV62892.1 hypothetical protein BD749_2722 [Pontibacter ramchanderi]
MKKIFLLYLLALVSFASFAQTNDSKDIYLEALNKYTLHLDSLFAGNRNHVINTIYLEIPDFVDSIPNKVNGYEIVVLTSKNIKQVYKTNNNSLTHTKLFPIKVENGRIVVSLIPYSGVRKRNGNLNLALGGGTQILFKYNCQNEYFEYERMVNWGI